MTITRVEEVGILQTVQVGVPHCYDMVEEQDEMGRQWRTSFFREPSTESRWLYTTHLDGNKQADLKHHGSLSQAVLLYAAAHYPLWQEELDMPEIGPGGFGENFTVAGLSEKTACIGDIYAIGDAKIQVTEPRFPCSKIERRWNRPGLTARAAETGRTGWYCSVLQEGMVEPGMSLLLVERPYPRWTVALVNDFAHSRSKDVETAEALAACPLLRDMWRALILKRVMSKGRSS